MSTFSATAFGSNIADLYLPFDRGMSAAIDDTVGAVQKLSPVAGRILDLGSGPGEPGCTLAAALPRAQVICSDVAEAMVDMARERAQAKGLANVSTMVLDITDQSAIPSASQDVVTANFALMSTADLSAALREVHRVLKPGGFFVGTVWQMFSVPVLANDVMTELLGEPPQPPAVDPMRPAIVDPALLDAQFAAAALHPVDGHNTLGEITFDLGALADGAAWKSALLSHLARLEGMEASGGASQEQARAAVERMGNEAASAAKPGPRKELLAAQRAISTKPNREAVVLKDARTLDTRFSKPPLIPAQSSSDAAAAREAPSEERCCGWPGGGDAWRREAQSCSALAEPEQPQGSGAGGVAALTRSREGIDGHGSQGAAGDTQSDKQPAAHGGRSRSQHDLLGDSRLADFRLGLATRLELESAVMERAQNEAKLDFAIKKGEGLTDFTVRRDYQLATAERIAGLVLPDSVQARSAIWELDVSEHGSLPKTTTATRSNSSCMTASSPKPGFVDYAEGQEALDENDDGGPCTDRYGTEYNEVDIWSAGVLLYIVLTGRPPWKYTRADGLRPLRRSFTMHDKLAAAFSGEDGETSPRRQSSPWRCSSSCWSRTPSSGPPPWTQVVTSGCPAPRGATGASTGRPARPSRWSAACTRPSTRASPPRRRRGWASPWTACQTRRTKTSWRTPTSAATSS
ncbi:unnamed protein product [Prorocentrum cordatum]|uniref:Methyltransferase domain-containing protein n=1 Tax=Prorocentrum cordatum TaxID=2364126 RepID=A0ABN9TYG2_9DINO|nr:unnamed protein product [Polarella glacialis]